MAITISGNIPDHEYYLSDKLPDEIILENTKRIGQYSFHFVPIKKINLEEVEFIGGSAFEYTNIEEVDLENICQLMSKAFANCDELSKVIIGNKLTSVEHACFCNCLNLKELILPNSVNTISREAFRNSGLIRFSVPPLVKIINDYVFYNCRNLKYLDLKNVEKIISDAIVNTAIEELILPNSIKILESNSINENKNLTRITIPATIKEIKQNALSNNLALEKIIFKGTPSEVKKIKGFDKLYEEYSDIIKIEPLSLDDILKNMHNHKKESQNLVISENNIEK